MHYNSKVYLRKQEDPIIISENGAKKLNEVFLDTSIPYDQPLNAGKISFFKSEVRRIEIHADTDDTTQEKGRTFFVIYSPSRNTIFQSTFLSYEDAKKELEFQMISIPSDVSVDWVIKKQNN